VGFSLWMCRSGRHRHGWISSQVEDCSKLSQEQFSNVSLFLLAAYPQQVASAAVPSLIRALLAREWRAVFR
jgi:hypothetical protein